MILDTHFEHLQKQDEILVWDPEARVFVVAGKDFENPAIFQDFRPSVLTGLSQILGRNIDRHSNEDASIARWYEPDPDAAFSPRPMDITVSANNGRVGAYLNTETMRWLAAQQDWEEPVAEAMTTVLGYTHMDSRSALASLLELNFNTQRGRVGVRGEPLTGTPEGLDLVAPRLWLSESHCRLNMTDGEDWDVVGVNGGVDLRSYKRSGWEENLPLLAGAAAINTLIIRDVIGAGE